MERRKTSLLKYWLTLIVGTIVISAGITWLVMNVGAQGMPVDRWTCASVRPGVRKRPRPSITTAFGGIEIADVGPICTTVPFAVTTVWFGITLSRSMGMTVTSTNARVGAEAARTCS